MLLENKCNNLFEEVSKMNYSWIGKLRKYVNVRIDYYQNALKSEAELDKNSYLANYDFLYACFKKNEETEELFAQYEVLKYLRVHMIIKCLKYVVGEWTFTDTDKEMLDKLVELQNKEHCMPRKLKFKSVNAPIEKVFDETIIRNFMLQYYDTDYAERVVPANERFVELPYLFTFEEWIAMLLQITTGKGMLWSKDHNWDTQVQLTDLKQFFEFNFNAVLNSTSKCVLVDEKHKINCEQYIADKKAEQKIRPKFTLGFKIKLAIASLYKEGDKTPFNLRNRIAEYAANNCVKVLTHDE